MDGENEMVEGFRRGSRVSFEGVVAAHVDSVYRFLVNLTLHREDAEDICQETFLEAERSVKSFRGESTLRTWLHKIAYRRYLKWRKKRGRNFDHTILDLTIPSPQAQADIRMEIHRALCCLNEDQRAVFVLAEVEQFDLLEVAQTLDIPLGTVKSRLGRAKAALRETLTDHTVKEDSYVHEPNRRTCTLRPE